MSTKLTDMICYRLDSELKTKLLDILEKEKISLSTFHRDIINRVLVDIRLTESMLKHVQREF